METGQTAAVPPQAQNLSSQPAQPPAPAPPPAPPPPPPPPPSQTPAPASHPLKNTKKRPLDSIGHFQNSPYYKMRAIVRDLRPCILEILQTPDFQNCKAAEEIREKMNIVMDLYKEMTAETIKSDKCQNMPAI